MLFRVKFHRFVIVDIFIFWIAGFRKRRYILLIAKVVI
jgi:hypothetical protein